MSEKNKLLELVKIVESLLVKKNISFKIHTTLDEFEKEKIEISIECPFCKHQHNNDKKKKLYIGFFISPQTKKIDSKFICFRCETKGNLLFLLNKLGLGEEFKKIYFKSKPLKENSENIFKGLFKKVLDKEKFLSFKKYEKINILYSIATDYFINRGFDLNFLKKRNIIFVTEESDSFSKKFLGYALIPNIFYNNFSARFFNEEIDNKIKKPRYLVYNSQPEIYGGIVNEKDKKIFIVEGPLDALKLNQLGFNSFAVGGKSKYLIFFKNKLYLDRLKDFEFIVVFDSDIDFFKIEKTFIGDLLKMNLENLKFLHMGISKFKDTGDLKNKEDFEKLNNFIRELNKKNILEIKIYLLKRNKNE